MRAPGDVFDAVHRWASRSVDVWPSALLLFAVVSCRWDQQNPALWYVVFIVSSLSITQCDSRIDVCGSM